ncbi:dynamin family protein [Spirochaeta isovalerica]|uniref:Ribosome biogenesis GTPase A n=1 Tax=Spirochaeta isovalerica TaxID=150 RepID=A0A841R6G9_9SPIO|nr:dynamin family protein [Spirochaeta isovalerica]MBB6478767.1 ribosome biogenesis GTPase A [Spirochaeta isovalerica]
MNAELIDRTYRENARIIKSSLEELTSKLEDPDFTDLNKELIALSDSLDKPFMFVIIGEVKSGKSSFINALTGTEICEVDADICTDRVQQVVYSDQPYLEHIEKYLDIKGINAEILKEISIVDTPGTDSIINEHEEITKRFAPNSNVIFFVFPALNPHHSSSWEMLKVMKEEWSRNIVFIAAQADRCSEKELETGLKKIAEYAREKGISSPVIFPTSSKFEKEGHYEKSGFREIRDFISDTTRGGQHMLLKLKDRIDIAEILLEKAEKKLDVRSGILDRDRELKNTITNRYRTGLENSAKEIDKILERMNFVFDRTSRDYSLRLKNSLSTANILKQAIPIPRFRNSRHKVDRKFLEEVLREMNSDLEKSLAKEAADNASFFIDGIKYRFSEIIREVEKARDLYSREAGDRALEAFINRRDETLTEILNGLTEMSTDLSLLTNLEKHNPDISDTVLKGGLVAAAGALLSIIAQGAVFDATGGALSAVGILGASGIILFKRSRMIREFRKSLEETNSRFSAELKRRLRNKLELIFDDIHRQFEKIDSHIEKESEFIKTASFHIEKKRNVFRKIKSTC